MPCRGRDVGLTADEVAAAFPPATPRLAVFMHGLAETDDSWRRRAGHSMGGLVIRSACHYGREASVGWVERVRHVFYLGSPHMGAPLARVAGVAGWVLSKVPETRPFAALAAGPSSVRDLRHEYVLDDDWADCGPGCCLGDHRSEVPLLVGASPYAISATVTADPASPRRLGGHPQAPLPGDLAATLPAHISGRC